MNATSPRTGKAPPARPRFAERIRTATVADARGIAHAHVRTWREAYEGMVPATFLAALSEDGCTRWWRRHLEEGRTACLVAHEDDAVRGWISFGPSRDTDGAGRSEIYALYVLPDHWGRGIGRHLIDTAGLTFPPAAAVTLWVLKDDLLAQRFYRANEFEPDSTTRPVAIGPATFTELRFAKPHPRPRR